MSDFVGQEHRRLVSSLDDRLEALRRGDAVPSVVVLEAEMGAGKSRIVREFYDRLRAMELAENGVEYWPSLPMLERSDSDGRSDPLPSRKYVAPPNGRFKWKAGAIPAFAWWGLSCEQFDSGEPVAASEGFSRWLESHGDAMWWAWNTRAGWLTKVQKMRDAFFGELAAEIQDKGIEKIGDILRNLGVPTFGLAWALKNSGRIWNFTAKKYSLWQQLSHEVDIEVDYESRAREIASRLRGLSLCDVGNKPGVPVVLAIEDAHLAGRDLICLMDQLATRRPLEESVPVLTVATAWPEPDRSHWTGWVKGMVERGLVEVWNVPELTVSDRSRIVLSYAPETSTEIAIAVAERWPNPLALHLLMSWKPVRAGVASNGNALIFTVEKLAQMPNGIEELFRARWQSLPDDLKHALALSRLGLPEGAVGTEEFVADIIASAACSAAVANFIYGADRLSIRNSVERAEDYEWLHEIDPAHMFAERMLADIAFRNYPLTLGDTPELPTGLRRAVGEAICDAIDKIRGDGYLIDVDNSLALVLARWVDALEVENATRAESLAAARFLMAMADARAYRFRAAIDRACRELSSGRLQSDHPDTLLARIRVAWWRDQSGRPQDAIRDYEALLPDAEQLLGRDHPEVLDIRCSLAWCLSEVDRAVEAVEILTILLPVMQDVLGSVDAETLMTQSTLAWCRYASGEHEQSLADYEILVPRMEELLGPTHPYTLNARNGQAYVLGDSGKMRDAVALYGSLVEDMERVLGYDAPTTLDARFGQAQWVGQAGDPISAARLYQELVVDMQRVLGGDHLATLDAKGGLARYVGESGDARRASELFRTLELNRARVLGANHRLTLDARNGHAWWTGLVVGRLSEGIKLYDELIPDMSQNLGENDHDTLDARSGRTYLYGLSDETRIEALEEYDALLGLLKEALPSDSLLTLETRESQAFFIGQARDIDGALQRYNELMPELTSALGLSHPTTLLAKQHCEDLLLMKRGPGEVPCI